ncbi:MAG: hypothetical protein JWO56_341 [Acidobacteria bacterium]|nr:hypothetical protein [Acidobacteriota bacterium]
MSDDRIARIVNAVLYEGYMLYPYRASSVKNRQRWNFGVVVPAAYHESIDPSERAELRTECLLEAGAGTTVEVSVRFLQLVERKVGAPGADDLEDCDETIEREITLPPLRPFGMQDDTRRTFGFPAARETAGSIVRSSDGIEGEVTVQCINVGDGAVRIAISIANRTPLDVSGGIRRDDALRRSFLSVHVVLTAHDGAFVSLLDPGDAFRDAAAQCRQDGLYPVLAGEEGDRQTVLAAPIILYDHPQVAPESPDDLFDGTEIDEILTLRIQTLSDAEKREIRSADARTRHLLERADSLEPEALARLHGTLRRLH